MIKKTTLFALFIVSYIPLFLILAVQNLNDTIADKAGKSLKLVQIIANNKVPLVLLVISLLSFIYYLIFIGINSTGGFRNPKKIVKIKNTGVEYLSYLATYIIPFIGLKFDTWNNLVATLLLFFVIGFIYTQTNLLYANPTLALFRYYIYQATFEGDEERIVICKGRIKKNNYYKYKEIGDDLYFLKTN